MIIHFIPNGFVKKKSHRKLVTLEDYYRLLAPYFKWKKKTRNTLHKSVKTKSTTYTKDINEKIADNQILYAQLLSEKLMRYTVSE